MATTVGTIQLLATIDTSQYKQGAREIEKTNSDIEKSADKTEKSGNASFNKIAKIGLAAVATAAIAVGAVIVSNIGGAIRRIDTLNNSTRVFDAMGFDANVAEKAMDELDKSIRGLPTPLDAAVRGMTSLASTYGDISKGQQIFTALNNAILGFGGTAAEVDNAIQQLSQLPMDGPLDAQTWNSLRNSGLTPVLVAMSKEMGISINEMKEQFGSGQLTVRDFTDELLRMNKEGGGGMKSLEALAKESTGGIGTAFANMQTAIQRAIAKVIQAFGGERITGAIGSITAFIDDLGKKIEEVVVTYLNPFLTELGKVFAEISKNEQVMKGLQVVLVALGVALGIVVGIFALAVIGIGALAAAIGWLLGIIVDFTVNAVGAFINFYNGALDWLTRLIMSIKQAFLVLPKFFSDLWGSIIKLFQDVGVAIGNAIGNAFRGAINGVLRFISNTINGFIDAINGAVDFINRVPGVNIGKIGRLPIPQLAEGGIVSKATLAMIGEGSEPEAVIPLSKLDKMLSNDGGYKNQYNIENITISNEVDGERWLRRLTGDSEIVSHGLVPQQQYMGNS